LFHSYDIPNESQYAFDSSVTGLRLLSVLGEIYWAWAIFS